MSTHIKTSREQLKAIIHEELKRRRVSEAKARTIARPVGQFVEDVTSAFAKLNVVLGKQVNTGELTESEYVDALNDAWLHAKRKLDDEHGHVLDV